MNNKKVKLITSLAIAVGIILGVIVGYKETGEINKNEIHKAIDVAIDGIATYTMEENEIKELPTTEIVEQTEEQENALEQEVENEGFELQGEIAYEGDKANTWNVELGDYKGLTYYSQIDSRWRYKLYTSVEDSSQTIGSSGCGPTSAAMVVTATKGAITPDTMSDLFVKYGYRSANQGTYWSAFRAVADEFNIGYTETTDVQKALQLLESKHLVIASCGNGLFTSGGHFIVLVGVENGNVKVYDPYLYAGKFETSTRREKVIVDGNTVYCPIDNFINYANAKGFFCYDYEGTQENNYKSVTTESYTRYVKVNTSLNVRNAPNGSIVGSLSNGTQVTVYETSSNWSRIGDNRWVCSNYLFSTIGNFPTVQNTTGITKKLARASILYSNSNLTGYTYNYKANTTITIIRNVNANVDYIRVNATGRYAYINNSNYTNTTTSVRSTLNQTRKTKACILYSNSNLTGTRYTYKANTTVTILQNVNSYTDKVRVNATGRTAYINVNSYK